MVANIGGWSSWAAVAIGKALRTSSALSFQPMSSSSITKEWHDPISSIMDSGSVAGEHEDNSCDDDNDDVVREGCRVDGGGSNKAWLAGDAPPRPVAPPDGVEAVAAQDGVVEVAVVAEVIVRLRGDVVGIAAAGDRTPGHVSMAKELLLSGSSSDWLPRLRTEPQLMEPPALSSLGLMTAVEFRLM